MNKLLSRFFIFFIGFPILITMIVFLPWKNHLVLNCFIILFSGVGALEMGVLFRNKGLKLNLPLTVGSGVFLPLISYFTITGLLPQSAPGWAFVLGIAVILTVYAVSSRTTEFPDILQNVSAGIISFIYPGYFLIYAVMISSFANASALLIIFVLSVYLNDAAAYTIGNILGRDNRNVVAVSPNKSMTGFIAGFLTSPGVFIVAFSISPDLFGNTYWKAILIGCVIGLTTIVGDLIESALKRSAGVKDSGNIIPGRGGVLDSIDSILFSAPFFYYLYSVLF